MEFVYCSLTKVAASFTKVDSKIFVYFQDFPSLVATKFQIHVERQLQNECQ
jgi:hypothetical protein